jgi:hypothetical protein
MSGENVITLIAALLAFIASLIAIYNTNFKRFTSERWWERKVKAYEDIVDALSGLIHYYRTLMDEELGEKQLSKEAQAEFNKRSRQGFNTIRRATDMGAFIISSEASDILQEFWKESENKLDPNDWYARFERNYEKAKACLDKITSCARKDLRV